MSSFLITGTSRGLGLELVKQIAELPSTQISKIFAVTRGPSKALQSLVDSHPGRVLNIHIDDITNAASIQKGVAEVEKHLKGKGLDVIINNAGTLGPSPIPPLFSMTGDQLRDVLNVNIVSAHLMTAGFLSLLQKGKEKKIINISTTLGSIAQAKSYQFYKIPAYKISKAGMNMLTAQYALDLEDEGFTVLAITPGWLKTDLGSQNADLEVSVGANAVKDIILSSSKAISGQFVNINVPGWNGSISYGGEQIPW